MILLKHTLHGRIRLNVIKNNKRKTLISWFSNLVLDNGLNMIAQSSNWLDCCHVGESSLDVLGNQLSLISPIQSTNNRVSANNGVSSTLSYFGISTITYQFPIGAVVGTIKEIGFGPSNVLGSALFNRALIKDQFDNPSYTVVNVDEALEVQYEIKVSVPINDVIGTINYNDTQIGYKVRPALMSSSDYWCPYRSTAFLSSGQALLATFSNAQSDHVRAFDGSIGDITTMPVGNMSNATYFRTVPYVPGTYQSLIRAEWDIYNANFQNGIKSLLWYMNPINGNGANSLGAYQLEFDEPIMKTNEESFRIDLGISWNRA